MPTRALVQECGECEHNQRNISVLLLLDGGRGGISVVECHVLVLHRDTVVVIVAFVFRFVAILPTLTLQNTRHLKKSNLCLVIFTFTTRTCDFLLLARELTTRC